MMRGKARRAYKALFSESEEEERFEPPPVKRKVVEKNVPKQAEAPPDLPEM